MSWKQEYETKCDAYELNIDPVTQKKKWTKRGINGDLFIYSNVDNLNDFKVRFELFQIQIWWKIFNPKLKKKGSKTRVVTFKRLSTNEETKETIALRFKNPQICQSFIAKWESLTRDLKYESTDDDNNDDDNNEDNDDNDGDDEKNKEQEQKPVIVHDGDDNKINELDEEKVIQSFSKIADKKSFRDLIKLNRLPWIDLINSHQILTEYYFNYGVEDKISIKNNQINYANYSYGKYNNSEHYLSLWMNSEVLRRVFLTQYKRPRVNMVICLDKSESMKESLTVGERSRMEIAQEALIELIRHSLDKQDHFAIITYNDIPRIEYGMTLIDDLPYGMVNLRRAILKFIPSGTTNLEAAYKCALAIFTKDILENAENEGIYNRIIFMTDLQLNRDNIHQYNDKQGIFGMIRNVAERNKIYTTFISMGVELDNNMFHSSLCSVRGCNYLTVHNKQEFISKFHKEKEFPYMIMPILYDVNIKLNTKIQQLYTENIDIGNIGKGELLNIKSMFGNLNYSSPLIIKFNYKKQLKLTVSFTDKNGKRHKNEQIIDLTYCDDDDGGNIDDIYGDNDNNKKNSKLVQQKDFYDSIGIRKVVLLCRYIDCLRQWIVIDAKSVKNDDDNKLIISAKFKKQFNDFIKYFEKEMNAINDKTLQKELDILKKLTVYQDTVDID